MSRWFRAYDETLDDPKVQTLPDGLFRAWFNLLCVTSKTNGAPFDLTEAAFRLRITPAKAKVVVGALKDRGLLDERDGLYISHNWGARQFKSDVADPTAADRMKRYRSNRKTVTPPTVTVTPTRAETEQTTEAEQKASFALRAPVPPPEGQQKSKKSRPTKPRKIETAIDPNWALSTENIDYARAAGLSEVEAAREWKKFKIHHQARGTTFVNWNAAWQGWVRKALEFMGRAPKDDGPEGKKTEWSPAQFDLNSWKKILNIYASTNNWRGEWGPAPGEPGCFVPPSLIKSQEELPI